MVLCIPAGRLDPKIERAMVLRASVKPRLDGIPELTLHGQNVGLTSSSGHSLSGQGLLSRVYMEFASKHQGLYSLDRNQPTCR